MMKRIFALTCVFICCIMSLSSQTLPVTRHAFTGSFRHTKITVSIWLEETADGLVSGELVYTSSKQKTPIRVLGTAVVVDGFRVFHLTEYQKDGFVSGRFSIEQSMKSGRVTGSWSDSNDPDKLPYQMVLKSAPFPRGKGGTFTYSSDPSGRYSYHYNHFAKGELGGHVEINYLKGNADRMSVEISKNDPNLADYQDKLEFDHGCFHGSKEDCDLTFDVHVFEDFVYVINTSEGVGLCDDFGAFTTLNGFYLKVE